MNMNGINAYESQAKKTALFGTQNDTTQDWEVGQQLQGIISNVSDQISIDFSGREVKVSPSAITSAREGETRTFQIMDISNHSIVLKEVGNVQEQGNAQVKTSLIFTQVEVTPDQVMKEDSTEEEEEADWNQIDDKATSQDYIALKQQGISLETFSMKRLERVLERVKLDRSRKHDQLQNQIQQFKEEVEQTRKAVESYLPNHPAIKQIAEQFVHMDQPVTVENVSRIVNALGMSYAALQLSDDSMGYLIQNELKPTVENVYKSVHSGYQSRVKESREAFEEVKDSIVQMLNQEGIEDGMEIAGWLFARDLPVTGESVQYRINLGKLEDKSEAELMNYVLENMTDAIHPEKTQLIDTQREAYNKFITQVSGLTLDSVVPKRQLQEIQMKLTYEAVQKLSANGIQMDLTQLDRIYEGLRQLEQEYYQGLMKDIGSADAGDITLLSDTQQAIGEIKQADVTILAKTFESRHVITLQQMSEVATSIHARAMHAEEAYEALMTAPRSDLGDSIQKAFTNVDSQLENLGLEITPSNQRAIRILGYNSMELSTDNVQAMKAYDAKVNELLRNLTPEVTASMIKDKVNPLNMPIEELNKAALNYRGEMGNTPEQKYSEFLVNLEAQNGISDKERAAYIGIYRLIYQVKKSDGEAIGALVKSGRDLTLSNLLTEVRSRKTKGMDVKLSDDAYHTVKGYDNSITESIESYYSETEAYSETIVRNILEELQPENLKYVAESTDGNTYDMTLEQLHEGLMMGSGDSISTAYAEAQLERLHQAVEAGTEALRFIHNYGEYDSINQILALQNSIGHSGTIYDSISKQLSEMQENKLKDHITRFEQALGSKEELQEQFNTFTNEMRQDISEEIMNESLASRCKDLTQICDLLGLQQSLARKENYSIPMAMGENVVQLNLTVIHNSSEKGQIRISLPMDESHQVNVQISVNQRNLQGFVTSNDSGLLARMEKGQAELREKLQKLGFDILQITYSTSNQKADTFIYASGNIYKEAQQTEGQGGEIPTDDLYQISKIVVEQLTSLT